MMRTALTIWQTDPITVQHGDVWQLGRHRLMVGDSTCAEDVAQLMQGEKAVLCMADPPYGMGKEKDGVANDNLYREKLDAFQMRWWNVARPYLANNASAYIWGNAEDLWRLWYSKLKDSERLTFRNEIVWDKANKSGLYDGNGIGSSIARMYANISERCLFFILGEQGFNENIYWDEWESVRQYLKSEQEKSGKTIKDLCRYWSKVTNKEGNVNRSAIEHYFNKGQWRFPTCEAYQILQEAAQGLAFNRSYDELKEKHSELREAFYATRAYFDNTHENMTDVWNYPRVTGKERYGHPTPKPTKMIERVLKTSSPIDSLTYDPFLGSGTSLIAGQNTGRRVYGLEINETYCETIIERWQEATGQQAQRVEVTTP